MERKILRQIMTELTVSVPVAGRALGDLCENAAYDEARRTGQIGGCEVINVGGKRRVTTASIRRRLGLEGGKTV